jgi:uncharacterized protein YjeT (DUF2065 family)
MRLSLFYLAGYLILGGLAMGVDPKLAMQLLFAEGDYGDVFPRLVGLLLLALGILVVWIIAVRAERMYPGTLVARIVILTGLAGLYFLSLDPFFVSLFVVVLIGFLLTFSCYMMDRARNAAVVH